MQKNKLGTNSFQFKRAKNESVEEHEVFSFILNAVGNFILYLTTFIVK